MRHEVAAVVGGQYGSEGKGAVVARTWKDYHVHVRVGAANAGHTGWIGETKVVSQQLPMAAWAYKEADGDVALAHQIHQHLPYCVIGPGAVISPEILMAEIRDSRIPAEALFIDPRAHVVTDVAKRREAEADLAERIGSTSTIAKEGIGQTEAARILREAGAMTFGQYVQDSGVIAGYTLCDTVEYLARATSILLEGTQGTGLSVISGQWPYTTSRDTTVAGLCSQAGVAPHRVTERIGVFRTYPIRVAGNSGPFYPGSEETTFERIGVEPETTTVTGLPRRVATWSDEQMQRAHQLNGFTSVYVTFFDYVARDWANRDSRTEHMGPTMREAREDQRAALFMQRVAANTRNQATLRAVGTGPRTMVDLYPRTLDEVRIPSP